MVWYSCQNPNGLNIPVHIKYVRRVHMIRTRCDTSSIIRYYVTTAATAVPEEILKSVAASCCCYSFADRSSRVLTSCRGLLFIAAVVRSHQTWARVCSSFFLVVYALLLQKRKNQGGAR